MGAGSGLGAGSGYLLPLGHPDLEGLLEGALRLAVLFEPRLVRSRLGVGLWYGLIRVKGQGKG